MSTASAKELSDELDLEFWFERESRSFKMARGHSGMQINAKECPHCGDARWRVYLNAENGAGNCFVCNTFFSKIGFIHETLGFDIDDRKAWARTYDHVREVLSDQGWRPKRMISVAVADEKASFPSSFALPNAEGQNLVYLEQRGITGELAKYFHLRCCISGRHWFTHEDGTKRGQPFDGRVIIPVYDLDGEFKTFQGRDVTGKSDSKYLFPKGLPGTGRYLFNGQNALRVKRVCVGEGVFDVMAMKIAFDEEVALRDVVPVGTFGKHLSYGSTEGDDQLGRFRQLRAAGTEDVTLMWDGEWKALIAALEAAEHLVQIGFPKVRIALLPAGKDPNEVPADVVRKAYWSATPYSKALAIKWRLRDPFAAVAK